MDSHLAEGEVVLVYTPYMREYGIKILDGGSSFQIIQFCPWCGAKLPEPLREQWIGVLESKGLEPDDACVPEEMLTEEWWQKRNL